LRKWAGWKPGQKPFLAGEIRRTLKLEMRAVEVTFLGQWDTVPGSSLKKYEYCKEKKGIFKRYLYWLLPIVDKGDRYKSDSYPAIRQIAHAVSLDEKRSRFAPLLLCRAISPKYTKVNEVWFPGAHADVGGGYQDSDKHSSNSLAAVSLTWMVDLLEGSYKFRRGFLRPEGNAKDLAHWSIGDFPANFGSACIDRKPSFGATIHPSVNVRADAPQVPIRWHGTVEYKSYPIYCSDLITFAPDSVRD